MRTTTRSRRLGALTTAAGVLVGLAVTFAPPAAASTALGVANVHDYTDSTGVHHVYGQVINTTSAPVSALVDIILYDATQSIVGSQTADSFVSVLAPGEAAPFEAQLDPAATPYATYEAKAEAAPPTGPLNHAFTTTRTNEYVDGVGTRHIVGTVTNNNSTPASDVEVVFTFLGASGVVGAESIGAGDGSPIAPGATVPFDEPVNAQFPAYSSWTAITQSSSAPSGDGSGDPATGGGSTGGGGEGGTGGGAGNLNCNPTLTLSTKTVQVGRTTTVTASGATPGSKLTLEGYSRPSTTYAPIRTEVTVAPDGTIAPFAVRPPTSARVRLQVTGCTTPGTGQVISVIPGLGITVTRVATRTYVFSGKIIPGKQNLGRAIALYVGSGSATPTKRFTAKAAADGSYRAKLVLPRGATRAYWATGADMTNLAGKSAVKAFTSS